MNKSAKTQARNLCHLHFNFTLTAPINASGFGASVGAEISAKKKPGDRSQTGSHPPGIVISEGSDVFTDVIVHDSVDLWLKTVEFDGSQEKVIVSEKLPVNENISCSS